MIIARVTADSIEASAAAADLAVPSGDGAQVVFRGIVRDRNQGRKVTGVSYDAFVPLAEKVFREIAGEARARWGEAVSVTVLHRVGRLEVGEASVLIAVTSPHRAEAFEASRYVIDQLKTRAPIWKQEHYTDGESEWLRGHALCQAGHHVHGEERPLP